MYFITTPEKTTTFDAPNLRAAAKVIGACAPRYTRIETDDAAAWFQGGIEVARQDFSGSAGNRSDEIRAAHYARIERGLADKAGCPVWVDDNLVAPNGWSWGEQD